MLKVIFIVSLYFRHSHLRNWWNVLRSWHLWKLLLWWVWTTISSIKWVWVRSHVFFFFHHLSSRIALVHLSSSFLNESLSLSNYILVFFNNDSCSFLLDRFSLRLTLIDRSWSLSSLEFIHKWDALHQLPHLTSWLHSKNIWIVDILSNINLGLNRLYERSWIGLSNPLLSHFLLRTLTLCMLLLKTANRRN